MLRARLLLSERAEEIEPPPELLTRITFEIPSGGAAEDGLALDVRRLAAADAAAEIRDGDGDDDPVVLDAGSAGRNRGQAAEAVRSAAGKGLGSGRRQGASRLGARREVLRKSAAGLRSSNPAAGVDGTGTGR